jgi:hypothetical protein
MAEDMEQQVNAIFQPQGKVYCWDCHYYVPSSITQQQLYVSLCQHPNARQTEETYEGVMTTRLSPQDRNRHNDCADWQHRTFCSDVGYNIFKQTMLLLAAFFLLVGFWKMVMR